MQSELYPRFAAFWNEFDRRCLFLHSESVLVLLQLTGLTCKILLIHDGKWNSFVESGLSWLERQVLISDTLMKVEWSLPAVFETVFEHYDETLVPFRTLTELTEAGETTLSDFHILQV
jgi:hypothetical protein